MYEPDFEEPDFEAQDVFMHPIDWQGFVLENSPRIRVEAFPELEVQPEEQEFLWIAEALEGKEEILKDLEDPNDLQILKPQNPHKSIYDMTNYISAWYKTHKVHKEEPRVKWINENVPKQGAFMSWMGLYPRQLQDLYLSIKSHPRSLKLKHNYDY